MLFNSGIFLGFFGAFLLLYYLVRNHLAARNLLILVASYIFYGAWDVRFLGLLVLTSLMDFFVARALGRTPDPKTRKVLLAGSLVVNLGILGVFKYYDFFLESALRVIASFGFNPDWHPLRIILPVGISFYTFQEMSYTIDVYRGKAKPANNLIQFLAYVSFFPQLVAGPIERASHLLPQFSQTLSITREMLKEGIWLCIWGMFKKVVIADNLSAAVEMVYGGNHFTGPTVIFGTIAFALQIHCDFSGYSDIARGSARLLGFDIMMNFNLPYSSCSLREFWRRWHISLSCWLRDYIYIPLGGNREGRARTYCNLIITMLIGGLWHGANWTYVLWGLWHGTGLAVQRIISGRKAASAQKWNLFAWGATSLFILYGWLLFRAGSFAEIIKLTAGLADWSSNPDWLANYILYLGWFTLPLLLIESWMRRVNDVFAPLKLRGALLPLLESVLLFFVLVFWEKEHVPFIYFQF